MKKLEEFLQNIGSLAIAFSGGLDSRFLAFAAKKAGCEVMLLHASGSHMPAQETSYAKAWAYKHNFNLRSIHVNVLNIKDVQNNSAMRCYFCKKLLFETFNVVAAENNLCLCDGSNFDDMQSSRPGLQALKELEIVSPLAACGIGKDKMREIAKEYGLDNAEQKSRPCLLTRLNYNLSVDPALLMRIAIAEHELERAGLQDLRLRLCPEPLLQCTKHDVPLNIIENILQKNGFNDVAIEVSDNISGYFDKNLK